MIELKRCAMVEIDALILFKELFFLFPSNIISLALPQCSLVSSSSFVCRVWVHHPKTNRVLCHITNKRFTNTVECISGWKEKKKESCIKI